MKSSTNKTNLSLPSVADPLSNHSAALRILPAVEILFSFLICRATSAPLLTSSPKYPIKTLVTIVLKLSCLKPSFVNRRLSATARSALPALGITPTWLASSSPLLYAFSLRRLTLTPSKYHLWRRAHSILNANQILKSTQPLFDLHRMDRFTSVL